MNVNVNIGDTALVLNIYVYIYTYIYVYTYICMYIYIVDCINGSICYAWCVFSQLLKAYMTNVDDAKGLVTQLFNRCRISSTSFTLHVMEDSCGPVGQFENMVWLVMYTHHDIEYDMLLGAWPSQRLPSRYPLIVVKTLHVILEIEGLFY